MTETYETAEGGFRIDLPEPGWVNVVFSDSEGHFALSLDPPHHAFRVMIQRFHRRDWSIAGLEDFERLLDGVLLGLEDALRPMKVMERRIERLGKGAKADLVVLGCQAGEDVSQRRRLLMPAPVPPGPLFLLTASCPRERFLVHRREFDLLFEGFAPMLQGETEEGTE